MRLSILLVLLPLFTLAQHPSHYYLESKELEGVDIYDIHQNQQGNYLIATDNGLFLYDGYDVNKLENNQMLSSSLFNIIEDSKGQLFCHNLSGQIFKVNEDNLEIFYTIPESNISSDIQIEINSQNELVIFAKGIIKIGQDTSIISTNKDITLNKFGKIAKVGDSIHFSVRDNNHIYSLVKGNILKRHNFNPSTSLNSYTTHLINYQEKVYGFDSPSYDLWDLTTNQNIPTISSRQLNVKESIYRFYPTEDNLWVTANTTGVYMVNSQLEIVNPSNKMFPNTFISTVFRDREGNTIFGTFGKGLIIMPNLNVLDFSLDVKPSSIELAANNHLFIGAEAGKVFELDEENNISVFRNNQVKNVEALYAMGPNHILVGEFDGVLVKLDNSEEHHLNTSSVKDVFQVNEKEFLIASNIYGSLFNLDELAHIPYPQLNKRHYCIGFENESKTIYAGTTSGLIILSPDGTSKELTLERNPILATDIQFNEGKAYVATTNQGVLIYSGDKLLAQLDVNSNMLSNQINQITWHRDYLIAATRSGVNILDAELNHIHRINRSEGLISENVIDMAVRNNELWLLSSQGVQKLNLDELDPFNFQPSITLSEFLVNDVKTSSEKSIFSSSENTMVFNLQTKTLKYQNELSYQYRLIGANTNWQTISYSNHIINFQSLSPGQYEFQAKAICRDKESNLITYSFEIRAPFYQRWWFLAFIFLGLLLIVIYVFARRLSRQKSEAKRKNELNASKLTAIQSQMNPHFIFNALNSIQDLVLKQDVQNSYNYITKFANLVRSTLNYSDKDFIEFESEVKLIELYLSLEKLRFKADLSFNLQLNGVTDISVPPMLIQPFIENALVHGLLHKEGKKTIQVNFTLEDQLICTIQDNGIGRKKSREINVRQRKEHESFSVNAIKRRFEILEENYGGSLGFQYEDLYDDETATGTMVILRIPVLKTF